MWISVSICEEPRQKGKKSSHIGICSSCVGGSAPYAEGVTMKKIRSEIKKSYATGVTWIT